jgi:hypothetical protein
MNYRTLFLKTYVAFLMTLVLVSVSFANVTVTGTTTESTEGEITSFGFNNPTVVSGLEILVESGGSYSDTEDLAHTELHQLRFNVEDIDGFEHLDVYAVLYRSDTKTTDSGLALQYLNSGVSDEALVIRWISPERSIYLSGLASAENVFNYPINSGVDNFLVKSGSTPLIDSYNSGMSDFFAPSAFNAQTNVTWAVNSGTDPVDSVELKSGIVTVFNDDNTFNSSGFRTIQRDVTIDIIMSKVAPSSGVWNYAIFLFDRLQQETTTTKTGTVVTQHIDNTIPYETLFYGEISVLAGSTVEFSGVAAGGDFTNSSGTVLARFISNGRYKQSFSSDTTWLPNVVTAGLPQFAYLVSASGLLQDNDDSEFLTTEGNRFALKALRTTIATAQSQEETTPVDLLLNLTDQEQVPSSGVNALTGDTTIYAQSRDGYSAKSSLSREIAFAEATNELGVESNFKFQVKLSPVFQTNHVSGGVVQTTQYTGQIRLLIENKVG